MAATVIVNEYNGAAPGTKTDKTSGTVRFKNADDANVDLGNPLVVPSTGQEYSVQKYLRLEITDAGGFTQIDNLRAYADGSNDFGTGIKVWYWTAGTYVQPEVPGEAVDPPQYPGSGSPQATGVDLFTATQGSPIDLDAVNSGPFTDGSPTEEIGDFLILVMEVEPTASQGVLSAETLTFAYDEI